MFPAGFGMGSSAASAAGMCNRLSNRLYESDNPNVPRNLGADKLLKYAGIW